MAATLETGTLHPLSATFEQIERAANNHEYEEEYLDLRIGHPAETGWYTPAEIFADEGRLARELMEKIGAENQTSDASIMGNWFFGSYTWMLSSAGIGSFIAGRRVPDISIDNVAFKISPHGTPIGLALRQARFTALPDDPAAGHPDVTIVADEVTLRETYREQYIAHLEQVIPQVRAASRFGVGAMWIAAADTCASMLIHLSKELSAGPVSQTDIDPFITRKPLKAKSGILEIEHNGEIHQFLDRASCCFYYKTGKEDAEKCSTCPLRPMEERVEQLVHYLENPDH
jgi:hypothetical protein